MQAVLSQLQALVGKPKYWEGQKVVKSDKCIGVSQLLGGKCPPSVRLWVQAYLYGKR